ncbi:MAG: TolC family protein [Saprospiraceae bacterium]|nr:TolC family protein [Saprospiraceae bacterium]
MKQISILAGLTILICPAFSQTTPEAAVAAALQNHPLVQAASFEVQAKKHGEKAALNLPNPEINAESPTGEFYAVGVLQSFEFPTVYARQKQVARAETDLARASQRMSENDLRYLVRVLYLETQVAESQARQWGERDTLYRRIAQVAARQFAAGELDFLQKTLAENEAGQVNLQHRAAGQQAVSFRRELAAYTGLPDLGALLPLAPDTMGTDGQPLLQNNPGVAYSQQAVQVAERQVGLAKSRALPNFSLGYLNQGPVNTPLDYRFRASIGIPLWAGQYSAGANAAKAEARAAAAHAETQIQRISLEVQRTQTDIAVALANVQYQIREALPHSRALLDAALRMREAGQVDYINFLRTLDEVYEIQRNYVEQVRALNMARLRLRYLSGN